MSKLWAFGDSYTAGIEPDATHYPPYIDYLKYLNLSVDNLPKEWVKLLAEKLGYDYQILAVGGASNTETFHNFAKNAHRYKKDDIIIINWSLMQRFRWGGDGDVQNENWIRLSQLTDFDERTRQYGPDKYFQFIGLNHTQPVWRNEIYYFENLIKSFSKSLGFHVFFWDMDNHLHYTLTDEQLRQREYILHEDIIDYRNNNDIKVEINQHNLLWRVLKKYGIQTIFEETDGNCGDPYHLGFSSHRILSELFYNYIKEFI